MKKYLLFLVIFIFTSPLTPLQRGKLVAQVPYRIRLSDSTYSAQLIGISGKRTVSDTVTGTWSSTYKLHEFDVEHTGPYQLYVDPAGGTNYSLVSSWGKSNGKAIAGYDWVDFWQSINSLSQLMSIGIGDTSISTVAYKDSSITMPKLSTTVHAAMGAYGAGTYPPDDVELEFIINGSDTTISIKDSWLTGFRSEVGDSVTKSRTWMNEQTFKKVNVDTFLSEYDIWFDVRAYGAIVDDNNSDVAAIQAALDSCESKGGGTVYFPPGTYEVGFNDTLQVHSNTIVKGAGIGATKFNYTKTTGDSSMGKPVFVVGLDSNITFCDFEIDGNAVYALGGAYGEFDHGIRLGSSTVGQIASRIIIERLYIHDTSGDGICVRRAEDVSISNSIISTPSIRTSLPQVGRNGIAAEIINNLKIINNNISYGFPGCIDVEPNANETAKNIIVSHNTLKYGYYAISLNGSASGAACDSALIDNNIMFGTDSTAVRNWSASNYILSNNIISYADGHGIECRPSQSKYIITRNEIHSCTKTGILIGQTTTDVEVSENRVYSNGFYGIRIAGTTGIDRNKHFFVQNNVTWNNDSNGTDAYDGLNINYTDSSLVTGNLSYDNQVSPTQRYGFVFANSIDLVIISNNTGFGNKTALMSMTSLTRNSLGEFNNIYGDLIVSGDIYTGVSELKVLNEGDIATIKEPFWLADDSFPLEQLVYKDTTFNNIDSSNYIRITNITAGIDADHKRITVNWLPYRTSLIAPTSGQRWAILCSNSWANTGTEPNRLGDATEIAAVDSADFNNKYLYCEAMNKTLNWTMTVGDTIVLYNPFGGSWEWSDSLLLAPSGSGWKSAYVSPGPLWLHSDGDVRILINGTSDAGLQNVGMIRVDEDSLFDQSAWHWVNNGDSIFTNSAATNSEKAILAISAIKSRYDDVYHIYLMNRNIGDPWSISYASMTEDGTIISHTGNDIMINKPITYDNTDGNGLTYPSVVRYGSKFLMLFCNRDEANSAAGTHDHWTIYEATSNVPFGPFTCGNDSILGIHNNNKISYRSGYIDVAMMFSFKNRLYALTGGTAIWHQSGSKANRQWGLIYRNERDNTVEWLEDVRSPLWINVMQKDGTSIASPIWGTGSGILNTYWYAYDHSGGNPTLYSNSKDGNLYVFFASNASSNDYRVWGMRLDTSNW